MSLKKISSLDPRLLLAREFQAVEWLARWICNPLFEGQGFDSYCSWFFVWDRGQWHDSVSSATVDPALNGYLVKSGEGKQEGCTKVQDGSPLPITLP